MKKYDSFGGWKKGQTPKHQRLISKLRKLVVRVAPNLEETSKWGNGVWAKGTLPLLFIHAKTDCIQFGFFAGATLSDPKKILKGKGKFVRHIRIEKPTDLNEAIFSSMILKAVKAPSYK